MATKEIPVTYKTYFKTMQEYATFALDQVREELNKRKVKLTKLYDSVANNKSIFKSDFYVDLDKYSEFIENKYKSGNFLVRAKEVYMNKKNNYVLDNDAYELYSLAILQKEIHVLEHEMLKYQKMIMLTLKDYLHIIKTFYTEVQRQMILNAKGYVFEEELGWTCINRYKVRTRRKRIDYAATKKREAELIAQGKRVYNKEQAEWCAKHGIEYTAEDKRVYLNDEYQYEYPLMGCKLPNGYKYKLERTDYRGPGVRGKSNKELIEECNNDPKKILDLNTDMKTKLLLCVEADKTMYLNFIRTPEQTPIEFKINNNKLA